MPPPPPSHCLDGTPALTVGDRVVCGSELAYHPLAPMTISQMVAAVGLPPIFDTTIIPRESNGNPRAVNRYDCRGLTQHCGKAGLYRAHGYAWSDAYNPWVHLKMTKILYDQSGLAPWTCSRCSLHRGRHHH